MNLDNIITALRDSVATSDYITACYGRALVFQTKWQDRVVQVPKVATGTNEYIVPLPEDKKGAIAFFQAAGREQYIDYDVQFIGQVTRPIAITWWGPVCDFTLEDVKWDVIRKLQQTGYVSGIESYVDERYQDVFPDFSGYMSVTGTEQGTQWLMYPYSGFRLVFNVSYTQKGEGC